MESYVYAKLFFTERWQKCAGWTPSVRRQERVSPSYTTTYNIVESTDNNIFHDYMTPFLIQSMGPLLYVYKNESPLLIKGWVTRSWKITVWKIQRITYDNFFYSFARCYKMLQMYQRQLINTSFHCSLTIIDVKQKNSCHQKDNVVLFYTQYCRLSWGVALLVAITVLQQRPKPSDHTSSMFFFFIIIWLRPLF